MDKRFILRVVAGPNAGAEANLLAKTRIGSGEVADIVIGDPDVQPDHFSIEFSGGQATLVIGEASVTVKGEARTNGRVPIAPFDLIRVGSTICAVGPSEEEWPQLSVSDYLTTPAEPIATAGSAAVIEPANTAAPISTPDKMVPRNFSGWTIAIGMIVLAAVISVGVVITYHLLRPTEAVEIDKRQQVEAIIATLGLRSVSSKLGEDGVVTVEGFVASNQHLIRLGRGLSALPFSTRLNVVSLEQQVTAMRTIASQDGLNLSIEPDADTGRILVKGLMKDAGAFAVLKQHFQRDIANLRPIDEQIVSIEAVATEVATKLSDAGLGRLTRVETANDEVRVSGAIPEGAVSNLGDIILRMNQKWAPLVKIVNQTKIGATPSPTTPKPVSAQAPALAPSLMPYEDIAMVVAGKNSFFYDRKGQRYVVGDKLANGDVIEDISTESVVVRRGDAKIRYPVIRR